MFSLLSRIEAVCVALATTGAIAALYGFDLLPIDRIGLYADLGAGALALIHSVRHRKGKHD